jgi:hypothetical protein
MAVVNVEEKKGGGGRMKELKAADKGRESENRKQT